MPVGLPLLWLDRVFTGLSWPIPAGVLGDGLPEIAVLPRQLRLLLLRNADDYALRDAVWQGILARARAPGGAGYRLVAVGLALPGLRGYRRRIRVRDVQDIADVQADVLAGFLTRLDVVDPATPNLAGRLIDTAIGYAARRYAADAMLPQPRSADIPDASTSDNVMASPGGAEVALRRAAARLAAAGTPLTALDLALIARTRLDGQHLNAVAADLGLSAEALYKRRRRAEARLAAHLRQHTRATAPDTARAG